MLGTIWNHTFSLYFGSDQEFYPLRYWIPFARNGWQGVNLFFILSGFVLYLPYALQKRQMIDGGDVLGFYRVRAARLLPLFYFSYTFCFILLTPVLDKNSLGDLTATLSLLFNLSPQSFYPQLNPPFWSLGIEILFSLLFPWYVIALRGAGLVKAYILTVFASLLVRYLGHACFEHPPFWGNFVSDSLFGRLDDFTAGMLLAHLYVARRQIKLFGSRHASGILGALLLIASTYLVVYADDQRHQGDWGDVPLIIVAARMSLTNIGFLLLLNYILESWPNLFSGRLFSPFRVLGVACYSIYAWHWLVIPHFYKSGMPFSAALAATPYFLLALLVLSALSFFLLEFPGQGWQRLAATLNPSGRGPKQPEPGFPGRDIGIFKILRPSGARPRKTPKSKTTA